jgi:hypothetical protein
VGCHFLKEVLEQPVAGWTGWPPDTAMNDAMIGQMMVVVGEDRSNLA